MYTQEIALKIRENVSKVIVGKEEVIDLILVALISGGNVLLEDMPGTGKTKLSSALSRSINSEFSRIQFTPDLLPGDITGINIYNKKTEEFEFIKGPVFANIVLADEINRATPRTQSGLLEAMEEKHVTVDGVTYDLGNVFFVIATQNPVENSGTFPLPEAQLDRFLMKLSVGLPSRADELKMLNLYGTKDPLTNLEAVAQISDILKAREEANEVKMSEDVSNYLLDIINATRDYPGVLVGASPRATLALQKAVKVYAAMNNRDYTTPDDVKYLAPYVLAHRIIVQGKKLNQMQGTQFIKEIIDKLNVPTEEF